MRISVAFKLAMVTSFNGFNVNGWLALLGVLQVFLDQCLDRRFDKCVCNKYKRPVVALYD